MLTEATNSYGTPSLAQRRAKSHQTSSPIPEPIDRGVLVGWWHAHAPAATRHQRHGRLSLHFRTLVSRNDLDRHTAEGAAGWQGMCSVVDIPTLQGSAPSCGRRGGPLYVF